MALTPESVDLKSFSITKFRDGYEMDQVEAFLDEVAEELKSRDAEKAELQQQIEELTAELEAARGAVPEPAAAQEETAPTGNARAAEAEKSSAMLQMALELHDKYVHEGETQRSTLIAEGEETAQRLVDEAKTEREDVLNQLGVERTKLVDKITELREYEAEYRSTLRSYIQQQLRGLDEGAEPAGAPEAE
ncbi:DivIVA domain-containing protein [Canibacter zhoujuaniae]|uniref:DivIVA domain-containing protein n=1 Tax=Canibacter zhoujuaniae TaxID=2708343 RepID=UPI00141E5BE7|nr:DivIVA domain-containing protein [Canibacter zhoujuaniae]